PWGNATELRERLRSPDPDTRAAAERELRQMEDAVGRLAGREPEGPPAPQDFTLDQAFEEIMNRYPPPLNRPPFNAHPRSHYRPVGIESEQSDVSGQIRKVVVIVGVTGDVSGRRVRFSVAYEPATGTYQDIHE